jgi:AraC family ethanolamine operon transcriptional activator
VKAAPQASPLTAHHATDPDGFAAALLGGQFEFHALPGRPFAGTVRQLQLGDLAIQMASVGPHRSRSALVPGFSTVLVPLDAPAAPPRVNGEPVGQVNALLVPGGIEFQCHSVVPHAWAALALPPALVQEWLEDASHPAGAGNALSVLGLAPRAARDLAGALWFAARLADEVPDMLRAACGEALAMSLRETLYSCLTERPGAPRKPRSTREAQRILADAEALLTDRLDQPIYSEQICAVLGISPRKLHYAFIAATGTSPHAYLKARRLAMVRRSLIQSHGNGAQRVKSIAMAHGFLHGGRFARDYQKMFGETPMTTMRSGGAIAERSSR